MAITAETLAKLIATLDTNEQAKTIVKAEDNPYANHTIQELAHGMKKGADNIPAKNMAVTETDAGMALEAARFAVADVGKKDMSAKRMAQARARAARKVEFDKIADSPVQPAPERMQQAWLIVFHLVRIVSKIAKSKQRWANRLLGSSADDIPQMALEKMALVLAKQSKFDLGVLREAAEQLAKSDNNIPGDQVVDERDPKEVKQVKKARKWLMGMANNRVMGALVDSYTSVNNLRLDNLDLISTVIASINGPGDDPMTANFKAARKPMFVAQRGQAPGGIDPVVIAVAVSAAITDRRLDPLTEFLLEEQHVRVDGAVKWSEYAEQIFMLTPDGLGPWAWDQVVAATEHLAAKRKARGDAARQHVRNLFSWLPSLIVATVEAHNPTLLGWSTARGSRYAVLLSPLDGYFVDPDALGEKRLVAEPALRFASTEEAARVLLEHLSTTSINL